MYKRLLLVIFLTTLMAMLFAETTKKAPIIKYKEYEEFNLDEMSLEGESGSPGDISIIPRFQKQFKNELPYRLNFIGEIKRAVETVR